MLDERRRYGYFACEMFPWSKHFHPSRGDMDMNPVKCIIPYIRSVLLVLMLLGAGIGAVYPADDSCQPMPGRADTRITDKSPVAYGEGLLWKIEGRGIKPGYLFGTIHLEDPRVTRLPPVVQEVFSSATSFLAEVDMHPAARAAYSERMRLPQGVSLQQYLETSLYQRLVHILDTEYALPESVLETLKPWAVFILLSRPPPETGRVLDDLLYAQAQQQGKSIHGLETVGELVAALDGLSLDDQIEILVDTVCNRDQLAGQLEKLTKLYLNQDVAGMLAINNQPHQNEALFERLMERTLYERNRRMALRIRDRLGDEKVFIAVGALHLPGERGILRNLEAAGYQISRVF
ncbi:MAG: TraB/GumN family protein [Gammaproteobacteria bacterium]|nr:MAG: TraB/GumN family protein [Gammaproteobacteria bacterium]